MADEQSKPPVVMLAFANERIGDPRYLRTLGEGRRRIVEELKVPIAKRRIQKKVVQEATPRELIDAFKDAQTANNVIIFHFGGHADDTTLQLEDEQGKAAPVDGEDLAALLASQPELVLVFLNGCSTRAQAKRLHGTKTKEGKKVKAVIGTSRAIRDDVAAEFAVQFYGFLREHPLEDAFEKAKSATPGLMKTTWRVEGLEARDTYDDRYRKIFEKPTEDAAEPEGDEREPEAEPVEAESKGGGYREINPKRDLEIAPGDLEENEWPWFFECDEEYRTWRLPAPAPAPLPSWVWILVAVLVLGGGIGLAVYFWPDPDPDPDPPNPGPDPGVTTSTPKPVIPPQEPECPEDDALANYGPGVQSVLRGIRPYAKGDTGATLVRIEPASLTSKERAQLWSPEVATLIDGCLKDSTANVFEVAFEIRVVHENEPVDGEIHTDGEFVAKPIPSKTGGHTVTFETRRLPKELNVVFTHQSYASEASTLALDALKEPVEVALEPRTLAFEVPELPAGDWSLALPRELPNAGRLICESGNCAKARLVDGAVDFRYVGSPIERIDITVSARGGPTRQKPTKTKTVVLTSSDQPMRVEWSSMTIEPQLCYVNGSTRRSMGWAVNHRRYNCGRSQGATRRVVGSDEEPCIPNALRLCTRIQ